MEGMDLLVVAWRGVVGINVIACKFQQDRY